MKVNDLILSIYADFGFDDIVIKLSTRPEKRVGSDEAWDKAEAALIACPRDASQSAGVKTAINPGEGAFYGPKLEYTLRDAIGREWQCGTTQVDFNMPGRFGAFYIGADSEKKTPVMIHRAMFGSLERFTGILIEHYAGHLPLWLAAAADRRRDDHAGGRRICARSHRRGAQARATRRGRSPQREDNL